MRISFTALFIVQALGCGDVTVPELEGQVDQGVDVAPPVLVPPEDAGAFECDAHFDPCSPSPCFEGVECSSDDGRVASCGPCPEGMLGDGERCVRPPRIEISEIDYDQPGADTMEFVEIANVGDEPAETEGLVLELVNGDNDQVYRRIALDPLGALAPGALALIAMPLVPVPEGVPAIVTGASAFIQNGPDAARLVDGDGNLLDAIVYGGEMDGFAPEHHAEAIDDGPSSLSRLEPGGVFVASCAPTPGLPNIPPCEED